MSQRFMYLLFKSFLYSVQYVQIIVILNCLSRQVVLGEVFTCEKEPKAVVSIFNAGLRHHRLCIPTTQYID